MKALEVAENPSEGYGLQPVRNYFAMYAALAAEGAIFIESYREH
jgi:hypothetical protein